MSIVSSASKRHFAWQNADSGPAATAVYAAANRFGADPFGPGPAAGDPFAAANAARSFQISGKTDTTQAYLQGGAVDTKDYQIQTLLIPIPDDVPDTITSSNPQLTIGGAALISTINTQGDRDVYSVHLEAGVDYEIGMLSQNAGPSGVPLLDAYLELYDAQGNKLTATDGGSETHPASIMFTGLDAMLSLRVETSGTYYVAATSFDQVNNDGVGDTVGDYQIFARPAQSYIAYYDLDSPLHSIDWGTQVNKVHQSVRNPDGEEGPRVTGNEYQVPAGDALGHPGKNVITYYFAKQGEIFVDEDPTTVGLTTTMIANGMEEWEQNAFLYAFEEYEKVADIVYIEVDSADEADFVIITYNGTPGNVGVSLLGRMSAPDEDNEGQTEINAGDVRWTEQGVLKGGFYFGTIVHELGHGHGLAHMHDTGGHSSEARGVESAGITSPSGVNTPVGRVPLPTTVNVPDPTGIYPDYTLGDYDLNQGVYSMMAYQDGWHSSPYGQAASTDPYGWLGSLMALDIAVIQDKYGVNEEWATGDDTYTLKDENAVGTYYSSIWDAGGTDQIVYSGARDTVIDLRPATLKYEWGGGGWISYAWGIHGGFTIANGVTIENATSGSGNDKLIGNDAANILDAGAGNDLLDGGAGNDTLLGGAGTDTLTGGAGFDTLNGGAGADTMSGGASNDTYHVDNAGDIVIEDAGGGADRVISTASAYTLAANVENLTYAGTGNFSGYGNGLDNQIVGGAGADYLRGGDGNDSLSGGLGNDILLGGNGVDSMTGGAGADRFVFQTGSTRTGSSADLIADFLSGTDKIDLSGIDANSGALGDQAFAFIGSGAFSGSAGELRAETIGGSTWLTGDTNGDGVGDFQIALTGPVALVTADFVL
jgi:Ca2+-binding RTX toxin-like protein